MPSRPTFQSENNSLVPDNDTTLTDDYLLGRRRLTMMEDPNDYMDRTVRAAVKAAVLAERARCANVARDGWMSDKVSGGYISGMVAVCEEIARLIEEAP